MPISGFLCSSVGFVVPCQQYFNSCSSWSSVFYAHGAFSLTMFISYFFMYRNNPNKHPLVGVIEQCKLERGKEGLDKKSMQNIPFLAIARTPAIWAIWVASLGNFSCVNMMFLYSPTYLSTGMRALGSGLRAEQCCYFSSLHVCPPHGNLCRPARLRPVLRQAHLRYNQLNVRISYALQVSSLTASTSSARSTSSVCSTPSVSWVLPPV